MPPIPKIKKEDILNAAFKILKDEGFNSISTRKLANILNCSTHPIYQTFTNMDEMADALYVIANNYFDEVINSDLNARKNITDYGKHGEWLELGISFVHAAQMEKNIYRFLYIENTRNFSNIQDYISDNDNVLVKKFLSEKNFILDAEQINELHLMVRIFTQGVATFACNCEKTDDAVIRNLLTKSFKAFMKIYKMEDK